jgi:5-formyltetrahydrofolate cyclo-ligase
MPCSWNYRQLSKVTLRNLLKARRGEKSSAERQAAAANAALLFTNSDIFQQSQQIACYYPFSDEFDCLSIIQEIWRAKKNCYLPVLSLTDSGYLNFVLYNPETMLKPNRYQIPEPVHQDSIVIEKLDLVLVPLLGFDLQGNRLGMGAGYYDRTFQTKTAKPFLLGVAYEEQCVSHVPHDSWDVTLNGVITQKRIIYF